MRLKATLAATIATVAVAMTAASPAAAERYNHCGSSPQRHFQCVDLADGSMATCPGGYQVVPLETLLFTDGNGDGYACAREGTSLVTAEDAIIR